MRAKESSIGKVIGVEVSFQVFKEPINRKHQARSLTVKGEEIVW